MKKDNIVEMPTFESELSDQDIVNLFMGLVRLVRRQYQAKIDALKTQLAEALVAAK